MFGSTGSTSKKGIEEEMGFSRMDFDTNGLPWSLPFALPMYAINRHFNSSTALLVATVVANTFENSL